MKRRSLAHAPRAERPRSPWDRDIPVLARIELVLTVYTREIARRMLQAAEAAFSRFSMMLV
ncbi:hypothetical protein NET02_15795, partial [Thermomicrobiaceae bacterium CFH 74404]